MSPDHKTIHNSREKTGRAPGRQPGHVHHGRKRQEPTGTREIPAPDKYIEDPDFIPTGRIVRKQLIKVHVVTEVIEYWTPEFRNVRTGQRVHADFPPGSVDDVNYDGTVKITLNRSDFSQIMENSKITRQFPCHQVHKYTNDRNMELVIAVLDYSLKFIRFPYKVRSSLTASEKPSANIPSAQ